MKQRGQVLVFTALLLPIMLLFFIAAVGAGMVYIDYTRLQNAADSAALAGATSYAKYYVAYCKKYSTESLPPSAESEAEQYAREAIGKSLKSVKQNMSDSNVTSNFNREDGEEQVSSTTDDRLLTVTETTTYVFPSKVTSTVTLLKNVQLPFIGELQEPIKVTASAEQPLTVNKETKEEFVRILFWLIPSDSPDVSHDGDWNVKNSRLTQ